MKIYPSKMKPRGIVVTRRIVLAALIFSMAALAGAIANGQTADPAITFTSNSSSTGTLLSVMNADGSNVKALFGGKSGSPVRPKWSPDGQWITFGMGRSINVISKLGGTVTLLATDAFNPAWSPLGDRIAYNWSPDSTGSNSEVRTIPAGGGTPQVLHHFQYPLDVLGGLSWSPDASRLTVAIYDSSLPNPNRCSNLSILDTVTGGATDVTHPLGFDWVANSAADWARHSNRIAFVGAKVGEVPALWVLDLDLMSARKLMDSSGINSVSWSPDDSKVIFDRSGALWTVDVVTGTQTLFAKGLRTNTNLHSPNWRRF